MSFETKLVILAEKNHPCIPNVLEIYHLLSTKLCGLGTKKLVITLSEIKGEATEIGRLSGKLSVVFPSQKPVTFEFGILGRTFSITHLGAGIISQKQTSVYDEILQKLKSLGVHVS